MEYDYSAQRFSISSPNLDIASLERLPLGILNKAKKRKKKKKKVKFNEFEKLQPISSDDELLNGKNPFSLDSHIETQINKGS